MAETRSRDLAKSLGQAVKTDNIASDGSLAVLGVTAYDSSGLLPASYDSNNAGSLGFAKDSDRLFVHTGQGWFNIAIINTTPIFTTSPSASYTLATDATAYNNGTATTITLAARDSEGFPLTWNYSANSAFNNIAYVSNDSSVYTIIPKSQDSVGEATPAVGTLSFTASDGINTATASATFSLTFDTSVANSESTSFFLRANGNNLDNNTFTDESDSPHTIVDNSSTTNENLNQANSWIHSFSPLASAGYSWLFGGYGFDSTHSSYFAMPNNARFAFGTGDYTIEYWAWSDYELGTSHSRCVFDFTGSNGTANTHLRPEIFSSGKVFVRLGSNGGFMNSGDFRIQNYEWYHYAFVRSSGTTKFYINGVEVHSVSDTNNYTSSGTGTNDRMIIGRAFLGTTYSSEGRWKGYIRDFRVVKGTAVYTSNFAPPTQPLEAITNTVLLTCNTPYVKGSQRAAAGSGFSVNNDLISKVKVQAFSPYSVQKQWSAGTHGGSIGPRAQLKIANHADFAFGTGDFTAEMWVWRDKEGTGNKRIWWSSLGSSGVGISIHENTSNKIEVTYGTSSSETTWLIEDQALSTESGVWRHVAVSRVSGTTRLHINGDFSASSTTSVDITNSSGFVQLCDDDGYASNGPMRIIKGTGVYLAGDFYPPYEGFTKTGSTYYSLKETYDDSVTAVNNSIPASHTVFLANWGGWGWGDATGSHVLEPLGRNDGTTSDGSSPTSSTSSQKYSVPSIYQDKTKHQNIQTTTRAYQEALKIQDNEAFTIEGWMQWNGTAEQQLGMDPFILAFRATTGQTDASTSGLYADVSNGGKLTLYMGTSITGSSAVTLVGPSVNVLDGNWHHFALARQPNLAGHGSGGNSGAQAGRMALWVDGTRSTGQALFTRDMQNDGGYGGFGGHLYSISPSYRETAGWNGYYSQMRIKKGQCLYPFFPKAEIFGTITPTTAFKTGTSVGNSGANTKLIACHAATLVDGSASSHTITAVGDAAVSNFAPRGDMKSVYFDGSGDYLTVPDSADWNMGSGNFTVEAWVFPLAYQTHALVVGQWTSSYAWYLGFNSTTGYLRYQIYNGSSYTDVASNNTKVPLNRWTHIAFAKTGSYSGLFVDGDLIAQTNSTVHPQDSTSVLSIGGTSSSQRFKGYISNVRVVKGDFLYNVDLSAPSEAIYG